MNGKRDLQDWNLVLLVSSYFSNIILVSQNIISSTFKFNSISVINMLSIYKFNYVGDNRVLNNNNNNDSLYTQSF